jgi:type I restriction enzyme M protein
VILTNPPFAGEMKDRKMLAHYELAKPALKRAKDKAPKEERDVLFIERVLKMLRPGGRAAIVLPQGKFNNSSLAFIREWILKKARLLAVVGLHPNTFKPHTGTKTSVLFFQKYTEEALAKIERVKQAVANACPNYEGQIKDLIARHRYLPDVPEDKIPEEIADLIAESFAETEVEPTETEPSERNYELEEPERLMAAEGNPTLEERISEADEKRDSLKAELIRVKQKLADLASDAEALQQQHLMEIQVATQRRQGTRRELQAHLKPILAEQKAALKRLEEKQKIKKRTYKAEIKQLDKRISEAEAAAKLLSNRGKLELILEDPDLIATLKERWIAAEAAKRLDYPIFMAVSERGGKDNSGDYEFRVDEDGSLVEFPGGHPQEGQLVVDQDLVNYDLTAAELADAEKMPEEKLCVAEAFVRFAQEQGFDFWRSE